MTLANGIYDVIGWPFLRDLAQMRVQLSSFFFDRALIGRVSFGGMVVRMMVLRRVVLGGSSSS